MSSTMSSTSTIASSSLITTAARQKPPGKSCRPPNLILPPDRRLFDSTITLESPLSLLSDDDSLSQLSSPSSVSSSSSLGSTFFSDSDADPVADDISKDLAVLEKIRKSVRKNLRLRPIRSTGTLSNSRQLHSVASSSSPWRDHAHQGSHSSTPSPTSSIYYTPVSETRSLLPARFSEKFLHEPYQSSGSSLHSPHVGYALYPGSLFESLSSTPRPLVIDTRPLASFQASHLHYSINIAIPSLILRRCRKPGGGFHNIEALRQFITTERDKKLWDDFMAVDGLWDGDVVVVHGENQDEKDSTQIASWSLLPLLRPILGHGSVHYLKGGISAAREHSQLRQLVLSHNNESEPATHKLSNRRSTGLFQLDTQLTARSKSFADVIPSIPSPLPLMPSAMLLHDIEDATPSPPPSQIGFRRPPPPRRPSVPSLTRLNTSSAEPSKSRATPARAATLAVTPIQMGPTHLTPHSPSHLTLIHSNLSSPSSVHWAQSPSPKDLWSRSPSSPFPESPLTPRMPTAMTPSRATFQSQERLPSTEEIFPVFSISTILPNFLYLGPELTLPEHVEKLTKLGVKRILNIAAECDDDQGLNLKGVFERYNRIPMRDIVEEDNISRGLKDACDILDDASLYGASTYVHCKAGKSRSVAAVMAYLIHANHWPLSRAYTFVVDRRKGISPNIGFVSELMAFEERELGGKSVGVLSLAGGDSDQQDFDASSNTSIAFVASSRRPGHIRESLPTILSSQMLKNSGSSSTGILARMSDAGEEMEIKDDSGRYRHVRRAPVDQDTLQPSRRVSKAGLECLLPHST